MPIGKRKQGQKEVTEWLAGIYPEHVYGKTFKKSALFIIEPEKYTSASKVKDKGGIKQAELTDHIKAYILEYLKDFDTEARFLPMIYFHHGDPRREYCLLVQSDPEHRNRLYGSAFPDFYNRAKRSRRSNRIDAQFLLERTPFPLNTIERDLAYIRRRLDELNPKETDAHRWAEVEYNLNSAKDWIFALPTRPETAADHIPPSRAIWFGAETLPSGGVIMQDRYDPRKKKTRYSVAIAALEIYLLAMGDDDSRDAKQIKQTLKAILEKGNEIWKKPRMRPKGAAENHLESIDKAMKETSDISRKMAEKITGKNK